MIFLRPGKYGKRRWLPGLLPLLLCLLTVLFVGCGKTPGSPENGAQDAYEAEQTEDTLTLLPPESSEEETLTLLPPESSGKETLTLLQPDPSAEGGGQSQQNGSGQSQQNESGQSPYFAQDADSSPDGESMQEQQPVIARDGTYTTAEDVALYLHTYGELPKNFITKKQAGKLGWKGGSVEKYAPGMCIGGGTFNNYEEILPEGKYRECDINTLGKSSRGAERLVYDDKGNIYYTNDHYRTFTLMYEAD